MDSKESLGRTIVGWRGLLAGEDKRTRLICFLGLLFVSASMTFIQFGFVGIGSAGEYAGYMLALLGPVTIAALFLGIAWGALEGVAAGLILQVHAYFLPLDLIERYFVTPLSSVVLYGASGFLFALLFALALRNNPRGIRRYVYYVLTCVLVSGFASLMFVAATILAVLQLESVESLLAAVGTGSISLQFASDFVLTFVLCVIADRVAQWRIETHNYVSVRTIFRVRQILSLFIAFMAVSAVAFMATTFQEVTAAGRQIQRELDYIDGNFNEQWEAWEEYSQAIESDEDAISTKELEENAIYHLIAGYDEQDGLLIVFNNGKVVDSNCGAYMSSDDLNEDDKIVYDEVVKLMYDGAQKAVQSNALQRMLYTFGNDYYQLGYMRAMNPKNNIYIMMAQPNSMVFERRTETMMWTTLSTLVLLVVVYFMSRRLLNSTVVDPVDRTNASLAKIMTGDLDQTVTEVGSVEFASLSAGINSTVDALKTLINEAERRNERDLATARAIQEGALPKVFPAFPDVDDVELYASMDAAKEVGGDFYDYFVVDDHTVGFLIADVSGKGIPGALFMMAAKNEIENRMLGGMSLSQAIAMANVHLCANNEAGMFVTVWAATLDWTTGELTYVNAGHNFPLLRHGRGGEWEWIKKKCGLFLGTFDVARYRQETLTLEPGDELILYTDGVNEAFNVGDEEYGNDRLERFLADNNDSRPEDMVRALRGDVAKWAEGAEQSDDVTILVVEYRA